MPQIIYRKSAASPWIKQGDRLTKTFSSGLCLIQQTYIAPKSLATYDAFEEGDAITESQPCIDGAFIFPAPDYQDTGDGFMRCTVTAYGRWKTEPNVTRQKRKLELAVYGEISNMPIGGNPVTVYFAEFSGGVEYPINKKEVITDDLVLSFVMPPDVDLPLTPPTSLSRLYQLNGEIFPQTIDVAYLNSIFDGKLIWRYDNVVGFSTITPAEFESQAGANSFAPQESGISFVLNRCDSVEYGHFSEYTAAFEATGTSFSKNRLLFRKK
jgi:hypothetical protein